MNPLARFVALGSVPIVLLVAGCQSQGEGERCTLNSDCQSTLFCLTIPPTNFGVCCPTQGSSVPTCNLSVSGTDAGTVTMDAAEEASVDAGSEPVEDAAAEAATD